MNTLRLSPAAAGIRTVIEVMVVPEGMTVAELYPALAPDCVEGPKEVGQNWTTRDGGETFAPPSSGSAPAPEQLVDYARKRREVAEIAGIVVDGIIIDTSLESQNRIANAYAYASAAELSSVTFKAASGWTELSLDQLKAVSLAVGAHIQACFSVESEADAGINASPPTVTTFAQVDEAFARMAPKHPDGASQ